MSGCRKNSGADQFHVRRAARHLRAGGLVAHATEGVWGLACDPFDSQAVARLLAVKNRDPGKGLIVIGAQASFFEPELAALSARQRARVESSWPGPVSWLLPNARFPWWISGAGSRLGNLVAVRVPGHAQSRAICAAFGGPLVSTSANPSGRPSTANELRVRRWFQSCVDYVVPGCTSARGRPSELRTLGGAVLR